MASDRVKGKGKGLSGQALKEFRSSVATLKRKGIVSKRVDARKQNPTRYMRSKVRKFQDVLKGTAIAVKASPEIRRQYAESEALEVRGRRIIVPKEFEHQRAQISRGMVQVVRPLKNGQEEYVILPFKITNMRELVERMIKEGDSIDALKRPDEFFSFRIGENNSQVPFINAEEMAEYLVKYETRLDHPIRSAKDTRQLMTFQRFKVKNNTFQRNPHQSTKPKKPYPTPDARGRNVGKSNALSRQKETMKKRRQRARETDAQRERRNAANALRMRQHRQRLFEGD